MPGLATSVYAASEGLSVLVLDCRSSGGQAGASARIENYLGFPTGISGMALMARAYNQAHKFGVETTIPSEVVGFDTPDANKPGRFVLRQLTYRESLRDIEACLRVQSSKLHHLGFRSSIARNTLANANATRDWRIYCDFAQSLIGTARRLYADEALGLDLKDTVYALDATTIDLCLSVFPWAPFRSTKAAVKLHTLLDLRGNIPSFIFISDGKLHDVNILDISWVRARCHLRHGSRIHRLRSARSLS